VVASPASRREAGASVGEPLRRFPFRLWNGSLAERRNERGFKETGKGYTSPFGGALYDLRGNP